MDKYDGAYEIVASMLPQGDVRLWFEGAAQANAGRGAFSVLIREYSKRQMELRGGEVPSEFDLMQKASNAVAIKALEDILNPIREGADGKWLAPTIEDIAENDATAVGKVFFGGLGAEDSAGGEQNAAWSGTVLFSALGSDQTQRLTKAGGQGLNTLDDFKNILFAFDAYARAHEAARSVPLAQITSLDAQIFTDIGIALSTPISAVDDLWQLAWNELSSLLSGDAQKLGKLIASSGPSAVLDWIKSSYQGESLAGSTTDESFVSSASAFFGNLSPQDQQTTVAQLLPIQKQELVQLAMQDAAVRNALYALSPIAVTLPAYSNDLSLLDEDSGQGALSEEWIDKRSSFLIFEKLYRDSGNTNGVYDTPLGPAPIPGDIIFTDLSGNTEYSLTVDGVDGGILDSRQVIFGGDGGDSIASGDGDDTLFGMDGSDNIVGGEGKDYIEGGEGNDTLYGSGGEDEIFGGSGSDELFGDDGEDYLDGGSDSDRLEGGKGFDTYIVDKEDTILDSDGKGHIELDGKILTGGSRTEDDPEGVYKNGNDTYKLSGNTLTINGGLVIEEFTKSSNDLGIALKDEEEEEEEEEDDTPAPDFDDAASTTSPIILDLDGSGIETTRLLNYFDHGGDGFQEKTGWIGAGDGFLARDLNGDGRINSGLELFGSNTQLQSGAKAENGFQALDDLDSNEDGVISSEDSAWAELSVWKDSNGNATVDDGELLSLDEHGIASINIDYTDSNVVDAHGHQHRQTSSMTMTDSTERQVTDVWFQVDHAQRLQSETNLSDEILSLPDAQGFGKVADLRIAMAGNETLKAMVEEYVAENDPSNRHAMIESIVYEWAGVTGVDPNSRDPSRIYGHVMDARQLEALEALVGKDYLGTWCWGEKDPNPHGNAAPKLIAEFNKFADFFEAQLVAQIQYQEEFSWIHAGFNTNGKDFIGDFDAFESLIIELESQGDLNTVSDLVEIARGLGTYSSRFRDNLSGSFSAIIAEEPTLAELLDGSFIEGTEGSDNLRGSNDADVLQGKAGDDFLYGNRGNDVYFFQEGDGFDRILDSDGIDSIRLGAGYASDKVKISRDATTLWITRLTESGSPSDDKIQVDNFFNFDGTLDSPIENIVFDEGETWDLTRIQQEILGGIDLGDNDIYGSNNGDQLNALAGNDVVWSYAGNDVIDAGDGDDQINAGVGDDTLIGGEGNDYLLGDEGSDEYLFSAGHGQDVVNNYAEDEASIDRIRFDESIASEDVTLERNGNDLLVLSQADDQILVRSFFDDSGNSAFALDSIVFSDGTSWDKDYILDAVKVVSEGDDVVIGYDTKDDVIDGLGGNDRVYGHAGNDVLRGGHGNDRLYGQDGNDQLYGGNDRDQLYGGEGDDNLFGDSGNDSLNGDDGDDHLNGGDGDDILAGGRGHDHLFGGGGNDRMIGGRGDDIYYFAQGGGVDHIVDQQGELTIYVSNLDPDQAVYRREGRHLVITFADNPEADAIYIDDWFDPVSYFAYSGFSIGMSNGIASFMDSYAIQAATMNATELDDSLFGNADHNYIEGWGGDDSIYGLDGDDTLRGDEGDDSVFGGEGSDDIEGGTGDDVLSGGVGDDVYRFSKGDGNDVISDESGQDRIEFLDVDSSDAVVRREGDHLRITISSSGDSVLVENHFNNTGTDAQSTSLETVEFADGVSWNFDDLIANAVEGTEGDDVIQGFSSDESINGGDGADEIYGHGGVDTILGGAGNDSLDGGDGQDTLIGGTGNDELSGGNGADALEGGEGADKLYGGQDDDILLGDAGNDELHGGAGNDELSGGGDADEIFGDSGADTLSGGAGSDVLHGGSGDDTLSGDAGHDILHGDGGSDTLAGGEGNDELYGTGELFGGNGDDVLEGSGTLDGGAGNDQLQGQGSDTLLGGAGDDVLIANTDAWQETANILEGGAGADQLFGSYGNDVYRFNLGDGQDVITETPQDGAFSNITPSEDTLEFGAGISAEDLSYVRSGTDLQISHANGTDGTLIKNWFQEPNDHFKVNRFIFADGTEWSDLDVEEASVTVGTSAADTLLGYRDLNEEVYAGEGNDKVWGRTGNDVLHGEAGDDYLDGEEGDDHLIGGVGNDNLVGRAGADTLDGGSGDDSLQGGAGDDVLLGGDGEDSLFGGEGSDQLNGGADDDFFNAGAGDDILDGGDGNDQLSGGTGDDVITGGLGDDKYVFAVGDGHDTINNADSGTDGVLFTGGATEERISFTRDGDDLVLLIDGGAEGSVRVVNHFLGGDYAIDWVQPDGGFMLSTSQINQRVAAGEADGDFDSVVTGTSAGEQLSGGNGSDLIKGLAGDDTLFAMGGDDQIEGGAGDDQLYGGNGSGSASGNDILIGGDGNDVLVGEDGDDMLIGGAGNDSYYYKAGQGVDVIDNQGGGSDGVFFLDGLDRNRLSYHQDGNDLVILVDGDLEQQVRVTDHFLGGDNAITYVQPTDGGNAIMASSIPGLLTELPNGTSDPDDGTGTGDGSGDAGDPGTDPDPGTTPTPELGGDDALTGSVDNDILVGGVGNDTLAGEQGNDRLEGGIGDDTYIFTGGQDVLKEGGGADVLRFGAGITFNQVASGLMRSGNDLVLKVNGGPDQVTLTDFFVGGDAVVETIEFEAGGQLTSGQLYGAFGLSEPTPPAGFSQSVYGTSGDDSGLDGSSNNDWVQGFNGNDTLAGAAGDDRLEGGNGNDSLNGGLGADTLIGGRGNDTYRFSSGDGQDVIDNVGGGNDILYFEDITFNQVASGLMKSGNSLVLQVSGGSDSVTIQNFFSGGDQALDQIEFGSGGQLTSGQIFGAFGLSDPDPQGSPNYQGLPDERGFGNIVVGTAAAESILASSDADFIDGGAGNDTLVGGLGNDYLIGGEGNDIYRVTAGDGQDTINNLSNGEGDDQLHFTGGIDESQLWFSRDGDDLVSNLLGSDDQVRVQDWYADPAQKLDSVQTDDMLISANQLEQLVTAMAAFGQPDGGEMTLTQQEENQVQAAIASSWQSSV
ncbi:calcium-binding protein [Marinobacter sp. 1Y8]